MPLMEMVHIVDPVDEHIDRIGDLSEFEVALNQVLVAIYLRPEKTASGIILSDKTRDEDKYQGKAGLVLKRGPLAFVDDDRIKFNGFSPKPGEWVMFRPSDGIKLDIRAKDGHCVLLTDTQIKMSIPSPDLIF
jgi:co-chaperonin GroES (HSP10)